MRVRNECYHSAGPRFGVGSAEWNGLAATRIAPCCRPSLARVSGIPLAAIMYMEIAGGFKLLHQLNCGTAERLTLEQRRHLLHNYVGPLLSKVT